jgi:hypothetical protein
MRKRFLVLASVATMALAGTAMPAFADSGTAATTTTYSSLVTVQCDFSPSVTINAVTPPLTLSSYKLTVSQQLANYLTSTSRTVSYPSLGISTTVSCHVVPR